MYYSTSNLIVTNEHNEHSNHNSNHKSSKLNTSKLKRIKIKDEVQLLGAIYNCLLRHDTDNEGLVCLNENIGFFLNYKANEKDIHFNKLESNNIIPSNVYIQPKKFGSLSQCYYSCLQMRVAQFFKSMDADYSLKLSYREFKIGITEFVLNNKRYGSNSENNKTGYCYSSIEENAIENLFVKFDLNRDGFVDFSEFIKSIRVPMCQKRIDSVNEAFNKLDRNRDGIIDLYDIKYWYINSANTFGNLRQVNDKINAAIKEWMTGFNLTQKNNDSISREDWLDYYMIISCCVFEDAYFDLLLRTCFEF